MRLTAEVQRLGKSLLFQIEQSIAKDWNEDLQNYQNQTEEIMQMTTLS